MCRLWFSPDAGNCIMRSFIICTLQYVLLRWWNHWRWDRWSIYPEINAYKIVDRKSAGNGSLGRPRHRWKDNNKIKLKEIAGCAFCSEPFGFIKGRELNRWMTIFHECFVKWYSKVSYNEKVTLGCEVCFIQFVKWTYSPVLHTI
jgi:hypothetical protein